MWPKKNSKFFYCYFKIVDYVVISFAPFKRIGIDCKVGKRRELLQFSYAWIVTDPVKSFWQIGQCGFTNLFLSQANSIFSTMEKVHLECEHLGKVDCELFPKPVFKTIIDLIIETSFLYLQACIYFSLVYYLFCVEGGLPCF